jgi:LCP family protein required for cell wall assembly
MFRPTGILVALLGFVLAGCSGLAAGSGQERATDVDDTDTRTGHVVTTESDTSPQEPPPAQEPAPTLDDLLGEDGRLTVLVLGSDARKGVVGERMDAIIVATIDPGTGKVAMVSLPRDTVNVPVGPGRVYPGRINSYFWEYERKTGKTKAALRRMRKALEFAFGTEIDYYVKVDFDGLVGLINRIGGIHVTLDEPFVDRTMHLGKKGLRLKAGTRHLDGKKALAYSRSRHSDSDYDRSRRQQQVLTAIVERVRERGLSALPALVGLVRDRTVTDFPLTAAPAALVLASKAKLKNPKSVVLAPSRWARPGAQPYTIAPRVNEVRKMFDRVFRPLP